MKFLLEKGANPELGWKRSNKTGIVRPGQEKGAKEISRWLGVTWEELVYNTTGRKLRDHSQNVDVESEDGASDSEDSGSSLE